MLPAHAVATFTMKRMKENQQAAKEYQENERRREEQEKALSYEPSGIRESDDPVDILNRLQDASRAEMGATREDAFLADLMRDNANANTIRPQRPQI
jgi:hypothetical protein